MKYFILLILAFLGVCRLSAQIQPNLTSGPVSSTSNQWLDLTMQVPPGMPSRAIITASLRQHGQEIWSGTSVPFALRQGMMQIRRGQLAWTTQKGEKPTGGPALFCIQILGDPG